MKKKIELNAEELVHVVTAINESFIDLINALSSKDSDLPSEDKDAVIQLLTAHNSTQYAHLTEALKQNENDFINSIMDGIEERRKQQETLNN